jgi:hypothetical protein
MFQREIAVDDVLRALHFSEEIQDHSTDEPFPSRPMLGWSGSRPLHVVITGTADDDELVVITVYEPDPMLWDAGFRRRRR